MTWLRKNRFQGLFAAVMVATLLGAQAFSCCLFNHQMVRIIAAAVKPVPASEHACCPKPATDETKPASQPGDCCLKDASHKAPQLASEIAAAPNLDGAVVAHLPLPAFHAPASWSEPAPRLDSGPPVYLTTLRLLI